MSYCNYCENEKNPITSLITLSKCPNCGLKYCDDCWKIWEFDFFNYQYFEEDYGQLEWRKFSFYDGEWICKNCWKDWKLSRFKKRYNQAIKDSEDINVYTKNYRGNINRFNWSNDDYIETDYFKTKEDAEMSLRIMAAYYDYDAVVKMELIKEKRKRSNYIYSIWYAIGYGANLN